MEKKIPIYIFFKIMPTINAEKRISKFNEKIAIKTLLALVVRIVTSLRKDTREFSNFDRECVPK